MSLDTHKLFVALHAARQLPSISAEDVEALVSATHAIHFIELGGHEYNFEDYLTCFNNTNAPPLRRFSTREEAHLWLKEDSTPFQAALIEIAGVRNCVTFSLDGGLPTPLRIPTPEGLASLGQPTAQSRLGSILLTVNKAREHLNSTPQHVEALTAVEVALHYIQESGLSASFEQFLADTSQVPIPPVRSFPTRDEADAWLKDHPRPPHGGWVRIGQDRYSVGYWRDSGRRVLLRVPTQEELKREDEPESGQ